MGTYSITKILPSESKVCLTVSFNNETTPEYYEMEAFDTDEIATMLQSVADDAESIMSKKAECSAKLASLKLVDGKLV